MNQKVEKVQPVILCGGSGERLWPMSRGNFPKQFIPFEGNESLFQQTMRRLNALRIADVNTAAPIVVAGEDHGFLVVEQARVFDQRMHEVIIEPVPRNTAPAITIAALSAMAGGDDPVLVVTPADHKIGDDKIFNDAISVATQAASEGSIVVLGVKPHRPETGYGYIRGRKEHGHLWFEVEKFTEKPALDEAQNFIQDGSYYWNAGVFVLKASVWISALEKFRPEIYFLTNAAWSNRLKDTGAGFVFTRPDPISFEAIPADSIDYAVMERCPGTGLEVKMVPLETEWNDLGSWNALLESSPKDLEGNSIQGDVKIINVCDTIVRAANRLVVVAGLDNITVVETADAVLVAHNGFDQSIKEIVSQLRDDHRDEHVQHRKIHRPWGWFDTVDEGKRFKVKRINVSPGASLSLQSHRHRSEHWVVVRGQADVVRGEEVISLCENQSIYIPVGTTHRLSNRGKEELEIIEVQTGDYLGEDDIIRYDDVYGRNK